MGKVRIYELAKEINQPSKAILDFLEKEGIEASNHMSNIEEDVAQKIRKQFQKTQKAAGESEVTKKTEGKTETPVREAEKKALSNAAAEKAGGEKKAAAKAQPGEAAKEGAKAGAPARNRADAADGAQRPKKKISAVFNPQNSKNGNRNQKSIVRGRSSAGKSQQQQQGRGQRPADRTERTGRPAQNKQQQSKQPVNPRSSMQTRVPLRKPTVKYDTVQPGSATSVDHSTRQFEQEKKQKEKQAALAQEEALKKNETAAAEADSKTAETQAKAETRQAPKKETAGKRTEKAAGERNEKAEKPNRKNKQDNRNRNAGRSDSGHDRQNRPNRSQEQGVSQGRKGGRVQPAAPAAEETAKKDGDRRGKGKKKQEFDKKGAPKKQERYVNLEKKTGHKKKNATPTPASEKRDKDEILSIKIPEYITVRDLADRMKIQASEIIKKLFLAGTVLTLNQEIDYEKAEEIALEFNCIAEPEEKVDVIAELLKEDEENPEEMVTRPPVVCVMGHVDHGKTSLLDAIRQTHVTAREAGGITQHIGASVAEIDGRTITFLDTPGHEAFTAMRMRGANSTDIAILVVAADDGIMPQTIEAINHAKAAGIEIIVAINKIDKPNANVDYVKQGLSEQGLTPEDWGGSTICVPVSAKTHEGIDELLEMVLLTADVLELKANPDRLARGLVIEAKIDKGRGVVATVLVQKGTLKQGEPIAAGACYGRARALTNHNGERVKSAGPSTPIEIIGLNNIPHAGEVFMSFDSEKDARAFAETFVSQDKEKLVEETRARRNLDNIFSQIQAGNLKELELIVKADVQGSVEAVKQSLEKLSNEEVVVKVIHGGVGLISESDVNLASASNAVIIGFNVKTDANAKSIAEHENVDIRNYSVIYKAIEDVEAAMKGMLEPIYEERVIGHAEIRQLFKASGVGTIAGSYILDGMFERDCKCRISREGEQIFEGNLASLKRFKDDVKQVKAGYECGLVFEGFNEIAEGDQVEAYKMVEVPRQ